MIRVVPSVAVLVLLATAGCAPGGKAARMDADDAREELVAAIVALALDADWVHQVPPSTVPCTLTGSEGLEWADAWEGTAESDAVERAVTGLESHGLATKVRKTGGSLTEVLAETASGLRIAFGVRSDGTAFVDARSACFSAEP